LIGKIPIRNKPKQEKNPNMIVNLTKILVLLVFEIKLTK
jgi:hypothetical protein